MKKRVLGRIAAGIPYRGAFFFLCLTVLAFVTWLFAPYSLVVHFDKYVPLALWIVVVTMAVSIIELIKETPIKEKPWPKRVIYIVTTAAALVSVCKGTAEFRIRQFDPIEEASGIAYINFDRIITLSEKDFRWWYPSYPPIFIRAAIKGGHVAPGRFSVTNIEQTTGRKIVNGHETRDLYTRLKITISSNAFAEPNELEKVSGRSWVSDYAYLDLPVSYIPEDVSFDGIVYLTINRDEFHKFVIPKAYSPHHGGPVYVPLNDAAREEMMKYLPWATR